MAMTAACVAAAVILFASIRCPAQTEPKKYAMLIGLNEYSAGTSGVLQLKYAVADVDTLEKILEKLNFNVVSLTNYKAERGDIVGMLYDHAAKIDEDDTFLLFFSGHGVRNKAYNNDTYWLTYDARLDKLDVAGIRLGHLLDYIRDIKARYKLILLDHCFSGDVILTEGSSTGLRDGTGSVELTRNARLKKEEFEDQIKSHSSGMVVLAAAKEEALESDSLKHGIFTAALCEALNTRNADSDNDAKLSMDELKKYLNDKVPAFARDIHNYEQEMVESTSGINLTGWMIADNLPLDDLQEIEQLVVEYKNRLDAWENMTWISFDTKIHCKSTLDKWVESVRTDLILDDNTSAMLEEIRKHMDSAHLPEDLLAKDLEDVISGMTQ
jgi:hypothetical protein